MKRTMYFRGIPVLISTHTVGQCFGTVAVATVAGERFESDVKPFGFESVAIDQVKTLAGAWLKPFARNGRDL